VALIPISNAVNERLSRSREVSFFPQCACCSPRVSQLAYYCAALSRRTCNLVLKMEQGDIGCTERVSRRWDLLHGILCSFKTIHSG
jgi:hypothetical protein